MGSTAYAAYNGNASNAGSAHTVTAMGRWSIINKQLPAANSIKAIHVYDFDNTREHPGIGGCYFCCSRGRR